MTIWLWIIGITAVAWPVACGVLVHRDLKARLLNVTKAIDGQNYAVGRRAGNLEKRIVKLENTISGAPRQLDHEWMEY